MRFMLLQAADGEIDLTSVADVFVRVAIVVFAIGVVLALMLIALGLFLRAMRRNRLAKSGIEDIDAMGGRKFEHYLEALFLKLGYKVELTKYFGDLGGDLVIQKDAVRTIVQAKRWKRNVGVEAVQQAVAAKAVYRCAEAMVVTNSHFTPAALELANKNRVMMWDRERLTKELERVNAKAIVATAVESRSVSHEGVTAPQDIAPLADVVACATCTKILTAGERQYCERNKTRFGGKMLCFRHQRIPRPGAPPR